MRDCETMAQLADKHHLPCGIAPEVTVEAESLSPPGHSAAALHISGNPIGLLALHTHLH